MTRSARPIPERPFGLPDRYRLRRHIATGGMASVWCAEDELLGRSVAVKILAERFAHDERAMQRFKREARAAARVSNHSHVVTVYDVGDLAPDPSADALHPAGGAFIVMEYLAGGTVADALHHDSVRRHEALRWLREAASALDHAHARGIVHRDIKPANFLLNRARVLHVADFGIARLTTEETITTSDQLFGTAAYLSPEQALGQEATGASDRYALAVVAFELLAGDRPFSAPHFSVQARQHIEEPPPAASERDRTLPPAVDEVLFAGLAKDPADRPESAGALVAALADALNGGSGTVQRASAVRVRGRAPDPSGPAASTAAARRRDATRVPSGRVPAAPASERARRRRVVALGAILTTTLVIAGVALAAFRGGGGDGSRRSSWLGTHAAGHPTAVKAVHAPKHKAVKMTRTVTSTTPTTSPPTQTTPEQLESTGHQQLVEGDYSSAIPTLQQAVDSAPPDSPTYAYALYDLGHAMVLSGDPQEAIPLLRKRLEIPDQQSTVRALLDQALAAAGESEPTDTGGAAPTGPATTPAAPTSTTPPAEVRPPAPTTPNPTGSGGAGLTGGRVVVGHGADGAADQGPQGDVSRIRRPHGPRPGSARPPKEGRRGRGRGDGVPHGDSSFVHLISGAAG